MKFPGYITAAEASERGFTHHGKYYYIPLWLAPDNPDFPIAAKWAPLEHIIPAVQYLEGFMRSLLFPDEDPCFQVAVMGKIRLGKERA